MKMENAQGSSAGLNNITSAQGWNTGTRQRSSNLPPANSWANPHQGLANKINRPMQSNLALKQNTNYVVNGNNTDFLRNITLSLQDKYYLNRSTMYRFMFISVQERFGLI